MFKLKNFLLVIFAIAAILPLGTFWFWTEHTTAANTAQNVEEKHLVQARLLKASLARYHNDLSEALLAHLLDSTRLEQNSVSSLQKGFGFRTVCVVSPDYSLVTVGTAIGFNCPKMLDDPIIRYRVDAVKEQVVEFLPLRKNTSGLLELEVITKVRGFAIYATVSTQIFTHLGSSVSFGESAHALIADSSGGLLFHPDTDYLEQRKQFTPFDQQDQAFQRRRDGVIEYLDDTNKSMIAGYAIVDSTQWAVFVTQPYDEVTALTRQNRSGAVFIAFGCLAIVLLLGVVFVRGISRPIEMIIQVANKVDSEKDAKQVDVSDSWRTPLEVREMQTHFNSMITRLSTSLVKVKRIAYTDLVTEGMNRQAFTRRTDKAIETATREGTPMVFLYVDLDDFKGVNDTYGHEAGDLYLKTIHMRMTRSLTDMISDHTLRKGGITCLSKDLLQEDNGKPIIARIGGDEFAAFFPFDGPDQILTAALDEFQSSISKPIRLGSEKVGVGTSIGVARLPVEGISQVQLSKNADMAMYRAKKSGKNRIVVYDQLTREEEAQRNKLNIDEAFNKGQFVIAYSPSVRVYDRKLLGVQASLNWNHPQKGCLEADFFEAGSLPSKIQTQLGEWTLEQICKDLKRSKILSTIGKLTLTVPSRLIANEDFVPQLVKTLEKYQLNTKRFELEVTEEALSHQIGLGSQFIALLKETGIGLTVKKSDKANTSLVNVDKVEFNTLKIDREMIKHVAENYRAKVVMETLIALVHRLGIQTEAEGVDDRATFDMLQVIGCQSFQGKLVNGSLTLGELEHWFANQKASNNASKKPSSLALKAAEMKQISGKKADLALAQKAS